VQTQKHLAVARRLGAATARARHNAVRRGGLCVEWHFCKLRKLARLITPSQAAAASAAHAVTAARTPWAVDGRSQRQCTHGFAETHAVRANTAGERSW
jgi:hypothetical protein